MQFWIRAKISDSRTHFSSGWWGEWISGGWGNQCKQEVSTAPCSTAHCDAAFFHCHTSREVLLCCLSCFNCCCLADETGNSCETCDCLVHASVLWQQLQQKWFPWQRNKCFSSLCVSPNVWLILAPSCALPASRCSLQIQFQILLIVVAWKRVWPLLTHPSVNQMTITRQPVSHP